MPDFRGIGGAQFYVLRRIAHLHSTGQKTFLIIGKDNFQTPIDRKEIQIYRDSRISDYSFDYSIDEQKDIVNKIVEFLGCADSAIVESTDPLSATWGELCAEKIGCKHILYSLIEPPLYKGLQNKHLYSLIQFKYKQGNLIGLSSKSLVKILGHEISLEDNRYVNISFDSNEIVAMDEIEAKNLSDERTFVIGTISRLEKAYVQVLIEEVISLAEISPTIKFHLIIIGDSIDASIKNNLESRYSAHKIKLCNVRIKFLGYLHPIHDSFFKNLDVFVGMGTSAISSISQKCATIVVDPYLNLSSGVLGLDTQNFAYSENGKQYKIHESLKYLLKSPEILANAQDEGFELYKVSYTPKVCMDKLDRYIEEASCNNYWNYSRLTWTYIVRLIYQNRNRNIFKELNKTRHLFIKLMSIR